MSSIAITITVDQSIALEEIEAQLRASGTVIEERLAAAGPLFGSAPSLETLQPLATIRGVSEVRPEHNFSLPPFEDGNPQ